MESEKDGKEFIEFDTCVFKEKEEYNIFLKLILGFLGLTENEGEKKCKLTFFYHFFLLLHPPSSNKYICIKCNNNN